MRRWFRQFIRGRTGPIPRGYAADMKHKLSLVYIFTAFNAVGVFLAILLTEYYPMTAKEKRQPGRYYARIWQGDDVSVIKVDGFKIVNSYEIKGTPKLQPSPTDMLDDDAETITETSNEELLSN